MAASESAPLAKRQKDDPGHGTFSQRAHGPLLGSAVGTVLIRPCDYKQKFFDRFRSVLPVFSEFAMDLDAWGQTVDEVACPVSKRTVHGFVDAENVSIGPWQKRTRCLLKGAELRYLEMLANPFADGYMQALSKMLPAELTRMRVDLVVALKAAEALKAEVDNASNIHVVFNQFHSILHPEMLADECYESLNAFSEFQLAKLEMLKLLCLFVLIAYPPNYEWAVEQPTYFDKLSACKTAAAQLQNPTVDESPHCDALTSSSGSCKNIFGISSNYFTVPDDQRLQADLHLVCWVHNWTQCIKTSADADKYINERFNGACKNLLSSVVAVLTMKLEETIATHTSMTARTMSAFLTVMQFIVAIIFRR